MGDWGLLPGLGRSPGEGKGYSLQYSGLENSMAWRIPRGHKESDMTEQLSLTFPASGSFPMSQLFATDGQSISQDPSALRDGGGAQWRIFSVG